MFKILKKANFDFDWKKPILTKIFSYVGTQKIKLTTKKIFQKVEFKDKKKWRFGIVCAV